MQLVGGFLQHGFGGARLAGEFAFLLAEGFRGDADSEPHAHLCGLVEAGDQLFILIDGGIKIFDERAADGLR